MLFRKKCSPAALHRAARAFQEIFRRSGLLRHSRIPEKQRYAPSRRKGDQDIYDTADHSALTAEKPGDQVKAENADETPVESADYQQHECKFVDPHRVSTFQNIRGQFTAAVIMHKSSLDYYDNLFIYIIGFL